MVIKKKLFTQPAAVLKAEPAAVARKNLNFYGGAIFLSALYAERSTLMHFVRTRHQTGLYREWA
jgi:hypothetical protein